MTDADMQLLDAIEDDVAGGGCIIDWHACDLFPRSWIDLVVVLRVDSSTLYDRLKARYVAQGPLPALIPCKTPAVPCADPDMTSRNYAEAKLQENLDSEIMEVLLQEAREAYDEEVVIELTSNTSDEMESNLDRIEAWVKQWKADNAQQ